MEYLFLLYDDENAFHGLSDDAQMDVVGAYMAYSQRLQEKGAFVGGEPLEHTKSAVRVRAKNYRAAGDDKQVQNGPFTDAKEQIGGFYRIKADTLDEALELASACPAALTGRVEVRPIWSIDG